MRFDRTIFATVCVVVALAVTAFIVQSCGIYSFTGTSIQPDVKTVTINYFEYKALKVNPSLSNQITEALKDKFTRLTKLEQVDIDGDFCLDSSPSLPSKTVSTLAAVAAISSLSRVQLCDSRD